MVVADRHDPATVQNHVVSIVELVGLVLGPLKDGAVHRSNSAVVSPAFDLDPVASPQITLHPANVVICHTAGHGAWVTALGPLELATGQVCPEPLSGAADRPRPPPRMPSAPR